MGKGASISLINAVLPSLLRWYGPANTSWLVSARIAGPRSSGAITRPFGSRFRDATSDKLRHGDRSPIASGSKIASIIGFAESPATARQKGDATADTRSRFGPAASRGHRIVRLAAKTGAATIDAAARPRICKKPKPIRAANAPEATIQRNLPAALDRTNAIAARPIVMIGNA